MCEDTLDSFVENTKSVPDQECFRYETAFVKDRGFAMMRLRGRLPGPRRQEGPKIHGEHSISPAMALEL
jgi:hypothetical protein